MTREWEKWETIIYTRLIDKFTNHAIFTTQKDTTLLSALNRSNGRWGNGRANVYRCNGELEIRSWNELLWVSYGLLADENGKEEDVSRCNDQNSILVGRIENIGTKSHQLHELNRMVNPIHRNPLRLGSIIPEEQFVLGSYKYQIELFEVASDGLVVTAKVLDDGRVGNAGLEIKLHIIGRNKDGLDRTTPSHSHPSTLCCKRYLPSVWRKHPRQNKTYSHSGLSRWWNRELRQKPY